MTPSLRRGAAVLGVALIGGLALAGAAEAATQTISTDPFTQATCKASTTTNHRTEVEPDSFSNGSTIVAAYQVGRIYDGGACAIGFATSTNNTRRRPDQLNARSARTSRREYAGRRNVFRSSARP